ncbi:extended synaptotagmin-1-like [Phaenicophaeus curvirostris]|uniref:extended synaptotagmin-1-like n=1 Tax=Phaenicophaeus curvirostris TaxID=33595 RepID=UPI0037F0B6C5
MRGGLRWGPWCCRCRSCWWPRGWCWTGGSLWPGGAKSCCEPSWGSWCRSRWRRGPAGSPRGGDAAPQLEPGEEESGTGGLRQRLPPADSLPEPESPRVQLSLWYHRDERKLVAIVHACRRLRALSREPPDPYVTLLLLPERGRGSKRKTGVQRRTHNPDFNERFEWDVSLEEASRRKLEAQVKSTVSFVSREKELLGKLHLDLAQVDLSEGGARWYELQDDRTIP